MNSKTCRLTTVEILESLGAPVAPGARALAIAQDRLAEKDFLNSIGAETADYFAVDDLASLEEGVRRLGRARHSENAPARL